MTSNILNQMGLGKLDIGYLFIGMIVLIIVMFIVLIIFIRKEEKLRKRIGKFMQGKEAHSLETEIVGLYEDNKFLKNMVDNNKRDIRQLYRNVSKAFQKVGIVKYDAYQQMGGLLSFSLALLDEHDDGFILNSVHSAEGCYTYTKEIKNGTCKLELGNEEKVALEQAMGD